MPLLLLQHWQIVLLNDKFIGYDFDPCGEVGVSLEFGFVGSGVEGWPAFRYHNVPSTQLLSSGFYF